MMDRDNRRRCAIQDGVKPVDLCGVESTTDEFSPARIENDNTKSRMINEIITSTVPVSNAEKRDEAVGIVVVSRNRPHRYG